MTLGTPTNRNAPNRVLAMCYGADRHPTLAPSQLEVALFNGDPANGGVELTSDGGYVRAVVDNDGTTWPDAPADGAVTSAAIAFATSTDAFSDTADYALILDASTGDEWDAIRLAEEIAVDGSDVDVSVQLTVNYNQES